MKSRMHVVDIITIYIQKRLNVESAFCKKHALRFKRCTFQKIAFKVSKDLSQSVICPIEF